jgi:hypothetical protein
MNESAREIDTIRAQLRAGIERDLRRGPRAPAVRRPSLRVAIPTLAAVAVATVAIVLGLTVSAASPSSASAAALRALAATAAAPSGTMTTTMLHGGVTKTMEAASWNGNDLAYTPGDVGPISQILLIGAGMYVQESDGTWLHYADASNVGPKPLGGLAQFARDDIESTTPQQILGLATDVQKAVQPDGSTLYTGTIPSGKLDPATLTGNDAVTNMILGAQKRTGAITGTGEAAGDLQLQMSVGGDGLVKQVSVTFQQDGTYTWSVAYTGLGSTPPIAAPASSTDVAPGTVPPGFPAPNTSTTAPATKSFTITPADRQDYLDAAACMRSNGVPTFPDPTFGDNTVTFNAPPSIDPDSSQARSAVAICSKLIPAGLPYSNRSTP